jgi:hypothetical protein
MLCALKGAFDRSEVMREQGAWIGEDGDLVLHCGDHLWIRGKKVQPGVRFNRAYPRVKAIPSPANETVSVDAGRELLAKFSKWRLGRKLDATILVGHLGLGMLAGAVRHRPNVLLLGEHSSGKSAIMETFASVLGLRMLHTTDATPAGITQRVGCCNMLIGLDEREVSDDSRRDTALLGVLRACYDGHETLRGGQDHRSHSFRLRCVVLAAAIQAPAFGSADRSRNYTITVKAPPEKEPSAALRLVHDARDKVLGTELLRRLADGWPRLQLQVQPAWLELLRGHGFDGRGANTLGTLLSIAWVMLHDSAPTQSDLDAIADDLTSLLDEERYERMASYERFLSHLFGLSIDPMRKGEWRTILEVIKEAAGYGRTELASQRVESEAIRTMASDLEAQDAQRQLSRIGIKIHQEKTTGDVKLLIANQCTALSELLRGTHWAGVFGNASPWSRLLARAPDAECLEVQRFASGRSRAVSLPMVWVLRGLVGPDPAGQLAAWEERERAV